jgi:hypothetical protein
VCISVRYTRSFVKNQIRCVDMSFGLRIDCEWHTTLPVEITSCLLNMFTGFVSVGVVL